MLLNKYLQVEQLKLANLMPHLVWEIVVQKEENFVSSAKENVSMDVSQRENYVAAKTQK